MGKIVSAAAFRLGHLFWSFDAPAIAVPLLEWAASRGVMEAHYLLAQSFLFAIGVPPDAERARKHLEASRQHHAPSQALWETFREELASQEVLEERREAVNAINQAFGLQFTHTPWRLFSLLTAVCAFSFSIMVHQQPQSAVLVVVGLFATWLALKP